jgi:hypothetical protein
MGCGLAAKRVVLGVLGGIAVAGIALAERASWSVAALGASDVAALVFVSWVWISVAGADAGATARPERRTPREPRQKPSCSAPAPPVCLPWLYARPGKPRARAGQGVADRAGAGERRACLVGSPHRLRAALRQALLHAARLGNRIQGRVSRLPRLRLPRTDDRDDVSSLRHGSLRAPRSSSSAASRSDLVRVWDRHRGDFGQLGRSPARSDSGRAHPASRADLTQTYGRALRSLSHTAGRRASFEAYPSKEDACSRTVHLRTT